MGVPFSPEVFGDFLLVQRLARSAMAEVLIAVRLGDRSGRTFVVKRPVLGERASGRAAQAIAREAEVLEAVRGPGFPALEAAGQIAGLPYVALEHVRGVSLDELLARASPLPRGAVATVARDLARALAALHAAGWVHGDVTPSNVIVDDAGEARLLDLGLARREGERRTAVAGTPGYVAPESALPGVASTAEDVYGFGVVVAECALGRRLHEEGDLVEAATRGDAPKALASWKGALPGIQAALARRPEARPGIEALLRQLEEVPADRGALAELVERWAKAPPEETPPNRAAPERVPQQATVTQEAALTPTAPMVLMEASAAAARSAVVPTPMLASVPVPVPAPSPSPAAARRWLGFALAGALILAVGVLAGRASTRSWRGTFAVAGAVPRRAQLELDDRPLTSAPDERIPVPAGTHTLAVVLPKGNRHEYTFQVHPNEHVVVVLPTLRHGDGAGAAE